MMLGGTFPAFANQLSDAVLVSINAQDYTVGNFLFWWENARNTGDSFPAEPDLFISRSLLVQEAEQMGLDSVPSYLHEVLVFLKARSLMRLKYEEVDSKIKIEEDEIKSVYSREFTPRRTVEVLYFENDEITVAAYEKLERGDVSWQDLTGQTRNSGGPQFQEKKTLRPNVKLPSGWREKMQDIKKGDAVILSLPKGKVLASVREIMGESEEDYQALRSGIRTRLRDKAENEINARLVSSLREKFHVKVNEKLIDGLDIAEEVPQGDGEQPVVSADNFEFSLGELYRLVRKSLAMRTRHSFTDDELLSLKKGIVNNYVNNQVLVQEALARHYEEQEPLKSAYDFKSQGTIIKVLKNRLFWANATVAETEIAEYFKRHQDQFRESTKVSLAAVKIGKEEGVLDRIWREVTRGDDFFDVSRRYAVEVGTIHETAVDQLDPEVRKVVAGLAEGEVSPPFLANGQRTMVRLLKKQEGALAPLGEVRMQIAGKIRREKFEKLQAEYLAKLRAVSEISLNRQVWDAMVRQSGE